MIKPFNDSPILVRRRWYRVPEGTPLLGMPTAFISDHWEPFPYLPREVGEVYPSPVRYTRNVAPPGMPFDHICGTPEQFANGAKFDPDFNSHPDEYWIPRCCGRVVPPGQGVMEIGGQAGDLFHAVDAPAGGVMIGGEAGDVFDGIDPTDGGLEVGGQVEGSRDYTDPTDGGLEVGGQVEGSRDYTDPTDGGLEVGGQAGDVVSAIDPTDGGLEVGGEAGDVVSAIDPTDGGLEVGGEAGDVFTPGGPIPGTTCATAGTIAPGQSFTVMVDNLTPAWVTFAQSNGTQYTVTTSTAGTFISTIAWDGTCAALTVVAGPFANSGSASWTATSGANAYIRVSRTRSGPAVSVTCALSSP